MCNTIISPSWHFWTNSSSLIKPFPSTSRFANICETLEATASSDTPLITITLFDFMFCNLNLYLEFQIMQIRFLSAPSFQYFLNCIFTIRYWTFQYLPEPSSSYILNAHLNFSSVDPQLVISVAIINSCIYS